MGTTPTHTAAASGDVDALKKAVSANPNSLNAVDNDGYTPLLRACDNGQRTAAKYLLSLSKCDKDAVSREGETCAHLAAQSGSVSTLAACLSAGVSPSHTDKDGCLLHHVSARSGKLKVLKMLHEGGHVSDWSHQDRDG